MVVTAGVSLRYVVKQLYTWDCIHAPLIKSIWHYDSVTMVTKT